MKFVAVALLAVVAVIAGTPTAFADDAPLKHNCVAPVVPAQPFERATAAALQLEIDKYKQCIETFANAQQAEARRHRDAANAAVADFNEFATTKIPKLPAK